MILRVALFGLSLVALGGCSNSSGSAAGTATASLVIVDPNAFATNVSCSDAPDAMQVYVATLFDVSEAEGTVIKPALPSSPPADCTESVSFGFVVPGRKYRTEIDAYDVRDLTPLSAGNRVLQQTSPGGGLAVPRWTARCGDPVVERSDAGATDAGAIGEAAASAADAGSLTHKDLGFLLGPTEAFSQRSVIVRGCSAFIESAARD